MNITKICTYCKKEFTVPFKQRNKIYCNRTCYVAAGIKGKPKQNDLYEIRRCLNCGKEFEIRKKQENKICSDQCRIEWGAKKENKDKRISKSKEKLIEKYGVDSIFKIDEYQKKFKDDFKVKYGVKYPMHVPKFVNKLKNTIREKHLLELLPKLKEKNLLLLDEYSANKNGNTSASYNFKCLKCGNIFSSTILGSGKIPICRKCNPLVKNSKIEENIRDFINKNNIEHLDNNRTLLNGKEIDLYLPKFNIGLEINGNYFHSEIYGEKDKDYHINKTILANTKNIKLLQIFEDEIILKPDIVFSRLNNFFNINKKIYARKCEIKEVTKKESTKFLIGNHLQGDSVDKIRLGLFYDNELVSIMTFGKKRTALGNKKNNTNHFELLRFCNKINFSVIGGFSKLLLYFIKTYSPDKIETYADSRWSGINPDDTVYMKSGFVFVHQTPPNYWYIKISESYIRYHRFNFRKDVLVKEGYPIDKTEWEIMQERGYDRIWDCGSMKFEMVLK